jgi:hypothetical protein
VTSEARELRGKAADPEGGGGSYHKTASKRPNSRRLNILMPMAEWLLRMRSIMKMKFFGRAFAFELRVILFKERTCRHLQDLRKERDWQAIRAASHIGNRVCIWCQMSCMHKQKVKDDHFCKVKWVLHQKVEGWCCAGENFPLKCNNAT